MHLQGASLYNIAWLIVNNANIPLQYQRMVLEVLKLCQNGYNAGLLIKS